MELRNLSANDWSTLSRLVDQALELPPEARSDWVATLDPAYGHFKELIGDLLARDELQRTHGFLSTLPKIGREPPPLAPSARAGDRVGPYRLLRQLGEGGMASVWLAERVDGVLRRNVALKLPHSAARIPNLAERMARERDILASLEHPNIARLYDAGVTEEGHPYLALEYVEGEPIDRYCSQNQTSIRERVEFVLQVARAVAYAHTRLVVHRDLKPSNIYVDKEGQIHLLDFGVAKLLDPNAVESAATQIAGRALTLMYASPEQIRGEPVSTASDVYSLGVVLYELLTGTRPHAEQESAGALTFIQAILTAEPPRPSEVSPDMLSRRGIRGDLDTIILKALKKEPRERYPTVAEYADDLKRCLGGQPVHARPDTFWYRARKFVRRNALAVGAGAALLLALGAGITLTLWQATRAEQEAARALAAQARLLTQTAADRLRDADVAGAQAIILEVLTSNRLEHFDNAAAISVFQETRASPTEVAVLAGHKDWVLGATYSPDGRALATASLDRTVRIWDSRTGTAIRVLTGHTDTVHSAAYSPDGARIVTASSDGTARIWDAQTGATLIQLAGHGGAVQSAAYSPDGQYIATGSDDQQVRIWNAGTGALVRLLRGHGGSVHSVRYSPDGSRIASASVDRTARLWDASSGAQVAILSGHQATVQSVAFSADGHRLLTASDDGTARVWNVTTGEHAGIVAARSGRFYSAVFSPDARQVATAGDDNTVRLWDAATGAQLTVLTGRVLGGHGDSVYAASFSPDGTRIVAVADDSMVRVWQLHPNPPRARITGHLDFIQSASFSPDGTQIATASMDHTARLWDARTGEPLHVLAGHADVVQWAGFSHDGARIATASDDNTVRLWDSHTGELLRTFGGEGASYGGRLYSVMFSPDGTAIALACDDKTARILDARTGNRLLVLNGHTGSVVSANYSPDGTRIVTASSDRTARIWNARTGSLLQVLTGHSDGLLWAGFAPDGAHVVTASTDQTARVWDARSGRMLVTLRGHHGRLYFAAYSPDGTRIVTASNDRTARIWDAQSGTQLAALLGHDNVVNTAMYSPDGQMIVTSSDDRTVRIWDARVAGTLTDQLLWTEAAQFDPLSDSEQVELGLPAAASTPSRARPSNTIAASALAHQAAQEEQKALLEQDRERADALLLRAFRLYGSAVERAKAEELSYSTVRPWRYRRATLARVLARDGRMREVAAAYREVIQASAGNRS